MAAAATPEAAPWQLVGRTLDDAPTPSAILDRAKLETNCARMLDAAHRLGLGWRAHIKTHKTVELTRLQVGDNLSSPVNIVVSTVVEAENILPLLQEYASKGREVNLLYSFPLYPSIVPRLAAVSRRLPPSGLSVMVDHPAQLSLLRSLALQAGDGDGDGGATASRGTRRPPLVFLKIDMGYHRAGVVPGTPACADLVAALLRAEAAGDCVLHGLYCHAGHSYHARADWEAMRHLRDEFLALRDVAASVRAGSPGHPLTLSVGATPSATTIQHPDFVGSAESAIVSSSSSSSSSGQAETEPLKALFAALAAEGFDLEVHAGVYPTLDLQQLATHARDARLLTSADIAISVLAEVASAYEGRGRDGTTEALVNAGCLALGREPCKDMGAEPGRHYAGWGLLMPWRVDNVVPDHGFPVEHAGWQVGRISQEHGILVWQGKKGDEVPLQVGQRVRIWPNHSCIAGAGFDWYLIMDSRNKGREEEIVDVWPRWRGW